MDDATYTYISDIKDRKAIGRGAYHKKNGSRSHKCTLSQDNMTMKEWKSKNGECKSINFNRPTTLENFKKMSPDIQYRYIKHLRDYYGARETDIVLMFGCSPSYFCRYIKTRNFPEKPLFSKKCARHATKEWEEFLGQGEVTLTDEKTEEVVEETVEKIFESPNAEPKYPTNITLTYHGMNCSDMQYTFNHILDLLNGDQHYSLTVAITSSDEPASWQEV